MYIIHIYIFILYILSWSNVSIHIHNTIAHTYAYQSRVSIPRAGFPPILFVFLFTGQIHIDQAVDVCVRLRSCVLNYVFSVWSCGLHWSNPHCFDQAADIRTPLQSRELNYVFSVCLVFMCAATVYSWENVVLVSCVEGT